MSPNDFCCMFDKRCFRVCVLHVIATSAARGAIAGTVPDVVVDAVDPMDGFCDHTAIPTWTLYEGLEHIEGNTKHLRTASSAALKDRPMVRNGAFAPIEVLLVFGAFAVFALLGGMIGDDVPLCLGVGHHVGTPRCCPDEQGKSCLTVRRLRKGLHFCVSLFTRGEHRGALAAGNIDTDTVVTKSAFISFVNSKVPHLLHEHLIPQYCTFRTLVLSFF